MYSACEDTDFSLNLPWKIVLHTELELRLHDCKGTSFNVNPIVRQAALAKSSMLPGVAAEQNCSYGHASTCGVKIDEVFRGTQVS